MIQKSEKRRAIFFKFESAGLFFVLLVGFIVVLCVPQNAEAESYLITNFSVGNVRSNYEDYVGIQITVGPSDIWVTKLGRYVLSTHSQTHNLKITAESDPTALASCDVDVSGASVGTFAYCTLTTPYRLSANTTYNVFSYEYAGGDTWYDVNASVTNPLAPEIASYDDGVYILSNVIYPGSGIAYRTYGPPNFAYETFNPTQRALSRPPNNLGLLAYWPFNEGSGTNVSDVSGNGRNGTLNSANWVTGRFGRAFNSTGSTNVALPNSLISTISSTNEITISAWFKGTNAQSAVRLQPAGNDYIVFPWNDSGTRKAIISTDGGVVSGVTVPGVEDNRWHHMVMTWKSNTTNGFKVYVDGVLANQRDSANVSLPNFSTFNFVSYLGTYGGGAGEDMVGTLDDVRIYSRELTASQVASLYRQGSAIVGGAEKTAVKNGLVAHWTFNGNDVVWSSATAGTAYDRVGGYNGTLGDMNQTVTPAQGKMGQALAFDGSNDYITVSDAPVFDFSGPFAFSTWIKRTGAFGTYAGIITRGASAPYPWGLRFRSGTLELYIDSSAGDYVFTPTLNEWYHIVAMWDGTDILLYVNGVNVSQIPQASAPTANSDPVYIGTDYIPGSSRNFPGLIDDVRVYNRALTLNEIKQLYRMGTGTMINGN